MENTMRAGNKRDFENAKRKKKGLPPLPDIMETLNYPEPKLERTETLGVIYSATQEFYYNNLLVEQGEKLFVIQDLLLIGGVPTQIKAPLNHIMKIKDATRLDYNILLQEKYQNKVDNPLERKIAPGIGFTIRRN